MTDALAGVEPGEPFAAVKLGSVVFLGTGAVSLAGIGGPHEGRGGDRLYQVEDTARCAKGQLHTVPDTGCGCGFWSVPDRSVLAALFPYEKRERHWFEMEVEVFGRVVVHDVGVRSSRQRVLGVCLPDSCSVCSAPADLFSADRPGDVFTPRCAGHVSSKKGSATFTGHELAAALGTEVSRSAAIRPSAAPLPARRRRPSVAAGFVAVTLAALMVLAAWQIVALRPQAVSAREATISGLSRADTESVLAQAAAVVAGGVPVDELVLSTSTAALYPVVAGVDRLGVVAVVNSSSAATGCTVVVRRPLPAFAAELVGGIELVDSSGGRWVVATRSRVDVYTCFEWGSALEQAVARLAQ
jgi:hypothetical protein